MRTENINRKFKLHDERRIAAQLPEQLQGLDVVGFVRVDEFPGELLNSFGEFASGAVPPQTRIYRNAQPNRIDAWLLDLLRQAGIGDRFYLRTGLEYFPWADCRVLDHRWLESLRRIVGPNQGFIAHDKQASAMTIGAQYEVLGFARAASGDPLPIAPAPAAPDEPAPYTLAALSGATMTSQPPANLGQPPAALTQPPAAPLGTNLTQPPAVPAMTAPPAEPAIPAHDNEATVLMSAISAESADAETAVHNTRMDAATQRISRDQPPAPESEAPLNDPR